MHEEGTKLDKVAHKVLGNMSNKYRQDFAFDPTIFMILVDVINSFIESCGKNNPPEDLQRMAKKPNWFHRWAVKRMVKREFDNRKAFRAHGKKVINALLKTGKETTVEEIQELMDEIV